MSPIDEVFYEATYRDKLHGMSASEHFDKVGVHSGYWPTPRFDPKYYLHKHVDVKWAKLNPYTHFLACGSGEGRSTFGQGHDFTGTAIGIADLRGSRIIQQTFTAKADHLSAIKLHIGNYRSDLVNFLNIAVLDIVDGEHIIQEKAVDGRAFDAREEFTIYFRPIPLSKGRRYAVRLGSMSPERSDAAWPIYLNTSAGAFGDHEGCTGLGSAEGGSVLLGSAHYSPPISERAGPMAVRYSPASQCNLNCPHCISQHTRTSAKRMTDAVRRYLVDGVRSGRIAAVASDYSGDLLWADHRSPGELDFLLNLDVPFDVDTNGAYLDAARVDKLLTSKMRRINISLDAATDAIFRRVRKGSPALDFVADQVRYLSRRASERSWAGEISVSFTLMKSNIQDAFEFLDFARGLGVCRVLFGHLGCYTEASEGESLYYMQQEFNALRERLVDHALKNGIIIHLPMEFTGRPNNPGRRFCDEPWQHAIILASGDVQACCVPGHVMGNLNETPMDEIWQGERYQALRLSVNSDEPVGPCRACPMLRIENNASSYMRA